MDLRPACAPFDDRGRGREDERRPWAEQGSTCKGADGADRDRASVVHLDRERLTEADEHDEGDEREDVVVGAEQEGQHARADADDRHEADQEREPEREREKARSVNRMCPRMPALLGWSQLEGRWQRLDVVARFRDRGQPWLAVARDGERLGACVECPVSPLELRAIDGEVGLVDQLVRVLAVARIGGDADRDRRADRLARRLDVERAIGDLAADPLGDLHRLLGARLRQQDAELLAAEPRRDVVVPEVHPEHLGEALEIRRRRRDGRTSC